jgi:hypothetical protein
MMSVFASDNTITVSVRDIYEAIAKNGFDHVREAWLTVDWQTGNIGACVLGQAAINLGIVPIQNLNEMKADEIGGALNGIFRRQLNKLGEAIPKWQNPDAGHHLIGDVIIFWNDLVDYDDEGESEGYHLPTYEDVTKMAYEVLSPHFDKEIILSTFIWQEDPEPLWQTTEMPY